MNKKAAILHFLLVILTAWVSPALACGAFQAEETESRVPELEELHSRYRDLEEIFD